MIPTTPLPRWERRGFPAWWAGLGAVLLLGLSRLGAAPTLDGSAGPTPHYVIGVSPFLDSQDEDEVYRQIVRFIIEDVPSGASVRIWDAYGLKTIARIDIPELRAFRSARTRANQFKDPLRKVRDFLAAAQGEGGSATSAVPCGAVRLPQFLEGLHESVGDPAGRVVVVVLGSPLYVDPKEPQFSMVDGYFPSDGHLLASRETSVYGVEGRADALKPVALYFGWFGDPWVNEIHRDRVQRFWSLYLQEQGGRLVVFSGDLATVFDRARHPGPTAGDAAARLALDQSRTKVEMLRITRNVGATDWITRETVTDAQRGPPTRTVGHLKIGIRWRGKIDLDLYARPASGGEVLFFDHMRSPEGYYFKDHRSSPDREYEFIEFETPVDVWQVEAQVNYYEGRTPEGPRGEVRIEFDGRIYTGEFSLGADHGNRGRAGTREERCWTVLDVPALLHLRPSLSSRAGSLGTASAGPGPRSTGDRRPIPRIQ